MPASRQPTQPTNPGNSAAKTTAVLALKELVARLYREQQKVEDLLISLSFALRSFNNLNQFLELVPLVASRVTEADGGALILFKPDGQIRLQQLHCLEGNYCQDVRQAFEAATRQMPSGQQIDERVREMLGTDVHLFGTPILGKNIERGRLLVFSREEHYKLTETRQKLIRLVADQTAVAIENDELTVELRKKERLDKELEIGAEIQLRLLPRQFPRIDGLKLVAKCKTASRVGGDYYDFIPIASDRSNTSPVGDPKGRWGIVIGDVMGKGVPAGLIMTMTRGMLRTEVLNGYSPARIIQDLNWAMYADLEQSHRFVTLFYSEYDPATQILSYCNAAHHPPILWQAAADSVKKLDTPGMLIGLDADSEYSEAFIQLFPGDTMIYYTDGFTEAANRGGDRFEIDRLEMAFQHACQQAYAPEEILDYLFAQVQQFVGTHQQNEDDMTLVVMQVQ